MPRQVCSVVRGSVFAQQGLKLGKDLLDRVEIGRVARQEEQLGAGAADQLANRLALMAAEVVHDDNAAGVEGGDQELFDVSAEAGVVDRPVDDAGGGDPVAAQGRQKEPAPAQAGVHVCQRPCGSLAIRRVPRGERPWRRIILVLAQVSTMNTRRLGQAGPGISSTGSAGGRCRRGPAHWRIGFF